MATWTPPLRINNNRCFDAQTNLSSKLVNCKAFPNPSFFPNRTVPHSRPLALAIFIDLCYPWRRPLQPSAGAGARETQEEGVNPLCRKTLS